MPGIVLFELIVILKIYYAMCFETNTFANFNKSNKSLSKLEEAVFKNISVCDEKTFEKVIDFYAKIFTEAFHNNSRFCIYYNAEQITNSPFIEKALAKTMMPFAVIPFRTMSSFPYRMYYCKGYIVSVQNFSSLTSKLEEHEKFVYMFKPHRVLIIFYENLTPYDKFVFERTWKIQAVDTVLINNSKPFQVEVKRMHNGEVLAKFKRNTCTYIRFKEILHKWYPNFTIGNTTVPFVISAFENLPIIHIDSKNHIYDGLDMQIMQHATKGWPVKYIEILANSTMGPWAVSINLIAQKQVDLALGGIFLKMAASKGLDMTSEYSFSCLTFLVPKPLPLISSNPLLDPVDKSMKISYLVTFGIVVLTVYLVSYANSVVNTSQRYTWLYSFMETLRIFTSGSTIMRTVGNTALRFLLTSWSLNSLLLQTGFSAGYTSLLTTPRHTKVINSIEDMVKENIIWGAMDNDSITIYEHTDNKLIANLLKNFRLEKSIEESNSRIRTHKYGVLVKRVARHFTRVTSLDSYGLRNLKVLGECLSNEFSVYPLKKNSAFTKLLDKRVQTYKEYGFIKFWFGQTWARYGIKGTGNLFNTFSEVKTKLKPIRFEQFKHIMIILIYAGCAAVLVFTCEILWHNFVPKLKRWNRLKSSNAW